MLSKLRGAVSTKTNLGGFSEENVREFYDNIRARLEIRDGESIFDLGCGSGAFLHYLREKGHIVAGMDYSASLVEIAAAYLPDMDIKEGEAVELPARPQFDHVVAMGLSAYFPDLEYAENVLRIMLEKSTKSAAMINVLDPEFRMTYEKIRSGGSDNGLTHFYIDKAWFAEMELKYSLETDIFSLPRGNPERDACFYHVALKKEIAYTEQR